jgi:hypothetical protein
MHSRIMMGVAALALGTACATAPAMAKNVKEIVIHPQSYSNTGPWSAPLSPGGISATGDSFGGPGFNGPSGMPYHPVDVKYSNTGPWSAPLSPGGISATGDSFGGPGFNGPFGGTASSSGLNAYASTAGARTSTVTYSNNRPSGAPLSPGGIATGGSSFGGPGYNSN